MKNNDDNKKNQDSNNCKDEIYIHLLTKEQLFLPLTESSNGNKCPA